MESGTRQVQQDNKVWQEWYCTKSGGGCGGYILVRLNMAINGIVEMVCPKCGHKHQRCIEDGQIKEQGRHNGSPTQEITPVMAAWSETPRTKAFDPNERNDHRGERDGAIIKSQADLILRESWIDRHAGKLVGKSGG